MKIPVTIKTYCPKCKKHTEQKVREYKAKKARGTLSWGQRKFIRKTKGYTSQLAGTPKKFKQSQKQTIMLECSQCKKKRPFTFKHAKKKIEIKKKENQ